MSDQTITCGRCGAANEPSATFCRECGALLAAYASPSGAQATGEAPTAPPEPPKPPPGAPGPPPPPPPSGLTWDQIEAAAKRDFEIAGQPPASSVSVPPIETPEPAPEPVIPAPEAVETPPRAVETEPDVPLEEVAPREAAAEVVFEPLPEPEPPPWTETVEPPPAATRRPTPRWLGSPAWSTSTTVTGTVRPQTVILIGVALFFGSCLWSLLAAVSPLPGELAFCLGPLGIILIIAGVVLQATTRPTRRF